MKKLLFLISLFISLLYGNELNYLKSIEEAKAAAIKNNKSILIMLTQEGCPTCEYMEEVAFANESFKLYEGKFYFSQT